MSIEVEYYMIRNYDKFQHYKHRNPPWIKVYNSLLDDPDFRLISDPAKLLYYNLLLYASRVQNRIPAQPKLIRDSCGIRTRPKYFRELIDNKYLVKYNASKALATCMQDACSEKRQRTETETETEKKPQTPSIGFDSFWFAYPRKAGKGAAKKAWDKIKPDEDLREEIINAIDRQKRSLQWIKDGGQFIPHPSTWLNQERWKDSTEIENATNGRHLGNPQNISVIRRIMEE